MEHAKCDKFIVHESSLETHSGKKMSYTQSNERAFCCVINLCFICLLKGFGYVVNCYLTKQLSLQQNAYPIKCPNGTFNPHEGRKHVSECVKCTEGFYCEPEGLEEVVSSLFFLVTDMVVITF